MSDQDLRNNLESVGELEGDIDGSADIVAGLEDVLSSGGPNNG